MIGPTRRCEKWRPQLQRPAWLEYETQTKASHKGVDRERGLQIEAAPRRSVLGDFRDSRLRVRYVKEIDCRCEAVAVAVGKFTRKTEVQLIHTRQALDSRRLKKDRLRYDSALSIGYVEGFCWLDGETSIVLEIDAGTEFPRKLVGAIDLEDIGRVEIQVVVVAVDVEVRVCEIVTRSFVRKSASIDALLALDGEACEHLPLVGQTFHGSEFNGMIGIVVKHGNVGDQIVEGERPRGSGIEVEQGNGFAREAVNDRYGGQSGYWIIQHGYRRIVRLRHGRVF